MQQMVDTTHRMVGTTHELQEITNELRDHIADFDDFFRPIRNYFYWEPHCYNIPICWSIQIHISIATGRRRPGHRSR